MTLLGDAPHQERKGRLSVVVRETSPLVEYPEGAELASGVTAIRVVRTSSGMAIGLSVDLELRGSKKSLIG